MITPQKIGQSGKTTTIMSPYQSLDSRLETTPHPSTGEGFNQGLATLCFFPLEFYFFCLSHPHLYSQPSFIIIMTNNSVREFFPCNSVCKISNLK